MAADPIYPGTIVAFNGRITNSTTAVTLVTGGTNGTRVEHLTVFNGHSASVTVRISVLVGATETILIEQTVATKVTWNVLQGLSAYLDKQFILLGNGNQLKCATPTAVAGDVDANGDGGNY